VIQGQQQNGEFPVSSSNPLWILSIILKSFYFSGSGE